MAYCEIAQRECEYLGFVERLQQHLLFDRATEERLGEEFSGIVSEVAADWLGAPNVHDWECSSASCGIVKRAIGSAITNEASIRFKDMLDERVDDQAGNN